MVQVLLVFCSSGLPCVGRGLLFMRPCLCGQRVVSTWICSVDNALMVSAGDSWRPRQGSALWIMPCCLTVSLSDLGRPVDMVLICSKCLNSLWSLLLRCDCQSTGILSVENALLSSGLVCDLWRTPCCLMVCDLWRTACCFIVCERLAVSWSVICGERLAVSWSVICVERLAV